MSWGASVDRMAMSATFPAPRKPSRGSADAPPNSCRRDRLSVGFLVVESVERAAELLRCDLLQGLAGHAAAERRDRKGANEEDQGRDDEDAAESDVAKRVSNDDRSRQSADASER